MRFNVLIVILLCNACAPLPQSSSISDSNPKALRLIDKAYESQIKTVLLYPFGTPIAPAVTNLGQSNLILEFDDLRPDLDTYYARIVHCTYDWRESDLQDLDFLKEYNEFPVNTYEFSVDTHIPYVHYTFRVPSVRLPGNYVLVLYRSTNKEDIILSRRFMVYDSRVTFTNEGKLVGSGTVTDINQQINFTVKYKNIEIQNPLSDVHVVIRQNQRWDNLALDVRPSFVHEIDKELIYHGFDESKMFRGGNEFRFFDLRSLNYPGRNVSNVFKTAKPFEVFVALDKSRQGDAYSQYDDLNGNFYIDNYDYRNPSFTNYANVHFSLQSPRIDGEVFVTGAFNYWNMDEQNKMVYDSAQGIYTTHVLLKQGWYDYQYVVKSPELNLNFIEGNYFQTENFYEVFVYYKPFQPHTDLLIGYIKFQQNAR